MENLRTQGDIVGYGRQIAGCMFPVLLNGISVAAFLDTGSTITIVNGLVARILQKLTKTKTSPSTIRAEVFGANNADVAFKEQMDIELGFVGGTGWFRVQILEGMAMDCILGDDVISRCKLIIDYEFRVVRRFDETQKMLTRGEVIMMMNQTRDLFSWTKMPNKCDE